MMRPVFVTATLGIYVGLFVPAGGAQSIDTRRPKSAAEQRARLVNSEALELAVYDGDRLAKLAITVEVDGAPVAELWDRAFARLFAFADRDRNGRLDATEASRLPSPFGLRHMLWGFTLPNAGFAPFWKDADLDRSGAVTPEELREFYREAKLGNAVVGLGHPPYTRALTTALLKQIDIDHDGRLSPSELRAVVETLHQLDANDDELISPGELIDQLTYPGANGGTRLRAPSAAHPKESLADGSPLFVLPRSLDDTYWTKYVESVPFSARGDAIKGRRTNSSGGGDSSPDQTQTAAAARAWRSLEPDGAWVIRIGTRAEGVPLVQATASRTITVRQRTDLLDASFARLRISLCADEGRLGDLAMARCARYRGLFAEADPEGRGAVRGASFEGVPQQAEIRRIIESGDADGDGELTRDELERWMELQEDICRAQVLLTILDHDAGLFELLDDNHDGSLSVIELRNTDVALQSCRLLDGQRLDVSRIPRYLRMIVSRGVPKAPIKTASRVGPEWFKSMDRNGDGVVSAREFTGELKRFLQIDLDADKLISEGEARSFHGSQ